MPQNPYIIYKKQCLLFPWAIHLPTYVDYPSPPIFKRKSWFSLSKIWTFYKSLNKGGYNFNLFDALLRRGRWNESLTRMFTVMFTCFSTIAFLLLSHDVSINFFFWTYFLFLFLKHFYLSTRLLSFDHRIFCYFPSCFRVSRCFSVLSGCCECR